MKLSIFAIFAAVLGAGIGIAGAIWQVGPSTVTPDQLGLVHTDGSAPHGRLVVNTTVIDIGQIPIQTGMQRKFTLTNEGAAELRLQSTGTTCHCTVSSLSKSHLAPGESAEVVLDFHAEKAGPFRQSATIVANDPSKPRVVLTVTGTAIPVLLVEPEDVVLGSFAASLERSAEIRIYAFRDEPLHLTHEWTDAATADHFALTIRPMDAAEVQVAEAKTGCVLSLRIKPGLPPGGIQQRIRLFSNLEGAQPVEIPIVGRVVAN